MNIYDIEAISTAAESTAISLKKIKLQLDCGTCIPGFAGNDTLFISHPHPDHWGGIINYIFLRKIKKMKPPKIILHADLSEKFKEIIKKSADMTSSELPADFISVRETDTLRLNNYYNLQFVPVEHRNLPALAIIVQDKTGRDQLAYTGDTSPETFLNNKRLLKSKILITESTYLGEDVPLCRAHEYSHTHLDDIYSMERHINNEIIALMHLSVRYKASDLIKDIKNRAPLSLKKKFFFIPPVNKRSKFIRVIDL